VRQDQLIGLLAHFPPITRARRAERAGTAEGNITNGGAEHEPPDTPPLALTATCLKVVEFTRLR
jgi:hypothetical protein